MARRHHQLRPGRSWHPWRRDTVFLASLLALLGLYCVGASVVDYTRARQFDDWWSAHTHIDNFVLARFRSALDLPAVMSLKQRLAPDHPDSGIIRLRLSKGSWESWQKDTPPSPGQWLDATLVRHGNLDRVKIRKRGDTSVHWMTDKKSFTLKTPKSSLLTGHRRLAFSVKEVLPLYLSNRLATEFDLLAPWTTVAPVFLNDRFYGIYRVSELVNESFLRRHARMPGNIFRGDTAERGEYFKNLPRPLFANPYIWDRVAVDQATEPEARETLTAFLSDINGTTFEHHRRLMSRLDRDEIARLIAYLLVVGDLYHMSGVHNQFWYEDPSTGNLHPVPWDVLLLDFEQEQKLHKRINRCVRTLCRDPFVIDRAAREIWSQLADDRLFNFADGLVEQIHTRYEDHFAYDRFRRRVVSDVGTPDEALAILRKNVNLLTQWLTDCTFAYHSVWHSSTEAILDIESRGRIGGDLQAVELEGTPQTSAPIQIVADRNRNGIRDDADDVLAGQWKTVASGQRFTLAEPLALLAGAEARIDGTFNPAPLHYRLFIDGSGSSGIGKPRILPHLNHRLSGDPAHVVAIAAPAAVSPTSSWHPWQFPRPRSEVHRLAGDVRLDKTWIVSPHDTLVIEPGTTVRLEHEVSILCHGRLTAIGKPDHPIVFRRAAEDRPWGALVLQGAGASKSILKHVEVTGGGRCRIEKVKYKGMVSIHRASDVQVRHCTFSENVESDDALNAVHAQVTVQGCTFSHIHADAIDFDYSSGFIQDCRFKRCGNDAIDLMTSSPSIIANRISEAADKGISIGESSHPFVFNNHITHCMHAIEVKDKSEPFLVNNVINKNRVGIAQIVKNWRYGGGGWAKIAHCAMANNDTNFKSDKRSRMTLCEPATDADSPQPLRSAAAPHPSWRRSGWIYAHHGIRALPDQPGTVEHWTMSKPNAPAESVTFSDDFGSMTDGWDVVGGHSRLNKRRGDLVMTIRRGRGTMSRNVDWDLTGLESTSVVVFEMAGENVDSIKITLRSPEGDVIHHFDPESSKSTYRFIPLPLPPARYYVIEISTTRRDRTGRVALHGYRLYVPESHESSTARRWQTFGDVDG